MTESYGSLSMDEMEAILGLHPSQVGLKLVRWFCFGVLFAILPYAQIDPHGFSHNEMQAVRLAFSLLH